MDNDVPDLDDFEEEIKSIAKQVKHQQSSNQLIGDYTKVNPLYVEDEAQKQKLVQEAKAQAKAVEQSLPAKPVSKPEPVAKSEGFAGLKKGFFGGGGSSGSKKPQTKPQIQEIKKPEKKANPLQIKQVQDAMKMNDYLGATRNEWMTNDFLNNVTNNQKIGKLFSNPEYMKAIDMFQKKPKQAIAKYGNNKEFMESFQEFCKLMGMQFQNLAQAEKKGQN